MELLSISYDICKLAPAISQHGFDVHYNQNYKQCVDDYLSHKDMTFNRNGSVLHEKYFAQLQEYREDNEPYGQAAALMKWKFGNFIVMQEAFLEYALRLQGNGWLVLTPAGALKTIKNHDYVPERIGILIDFWEHAYVYTHENCKKSYLRKHWGILDWEKINQFL